MTSVTASRLLRIWDIGRSLMSSPPPKPPHRFLKVLPEPRSHSHGEEKKISVISIFPTLEITLSFERRKLPHHSYVTYSTSHRHRLDPRRCQDVQLRSSGLKVVPVGSWLAACEKLLRHEERVGRQDPACGGRVTRTVSAEGLERPACGIIVEFVVVARLSAEHNWAASRGYGRYVGRRNFFHLRWTESYRTEPNHTEREERNPNETWVRSWSGWVGAISNQGRARAMVVTRGIYVGMI